MSACSGKTVLISGNNNGTGLAIGLLYANAGANILFILDKNESYDRNTLDEIKSINSKILLHQLDVRDESLVEKFIEEKTQTQFNGNIDILINNLGLALNMDTIHIHAQQFDSMHTLNIRTAFLLSKICHAKLKKSSNPHIINISPPLNIDKKWFKNHLAFSMSSYSMSMCTLGMSEEFKKSGIAVNSLWSEKNIFTNDLPQEQDKQAVIKLAEAAFALGQKKAKGCTGNFFIDENLLLKS